MLTQDVVTSLNNQLNLEYYSSNFYMQASAWCEGQGMDGAATFLREHASEEMAHANRIFAYVNTSGAMAVIGSVEASPSSYESVVALFEAIMVHEELVSSRINELAGLVFKNNDFTSFNFLQWFVAEQHEEEHLFRSILDRIKLIGDQASSLYFIDQEIAKLATEAVQAVDAPAA